jgi:hypothetical protein
MNQLILYDWLSLQASKMGILFQRNTRQNDCFVFVVCGGAFDIGQLTDSSVRVERFAFIPATLVKTTSVAVDGK